MTRALTDQPWLPVVVAFFVLALVHWFMRRHRARAVAVKWLSEHDYQARRLTLPWWSLRAYRFGPALLRNNDHAFEFRAEVEDRKLGGYGVVWLRVWIGWTGAEIHDTDVSWETMPDALREVEGARPGAPWEAAQLDLLGRVASGEHTFRPDSQRSPEAGERFDLLVEHVLAMQRRGLLTCATPVAEARVAGRTYAFVSDVQLTPEGERIAEKREERSV